MGDANFMGGLLGGLSQTLQRQQEDSFKQALIKSQIDLIKTQAKHEEQKVKTAQTLDEFRSKYFGGGGVETQAAGQPGQTGVGTPYVGVNDPWTKEAAAAKLFLDVNLPAPNMRPSTTKLADGTILTTLNGKIVSAIPGPVENEKVMGTGPGGVPTAYHIPKSFTYPGSAQGGGAGVPGGATPGGGGLGPQPPQLGIPVGPRPMGYAPTVGNTGAEFMRAVPQVPLPGEDYQKKPSARDLPPDVPNEAKQKLVGMETFVSQLEQLAKAGAANKDLFGSLKEAQYRAGRTFVGGLPLIGDLIRSNPELASFMQLNDTVHATRLFEMGGKQATAMELQTILNTLATTRDWETFKTQSNVAVKLAKELKEQVKASYRGTERELLSPGQNQAKPTAAVDMQSGYQNRLNRVQAMPEGPAKQQALQVLQNWARDNLVK